MLAAVLLLAAGCKSSTDPGSSNQIPLIPLAIGNEWMYDELSLDSTGEVMRTFHDTVQIIANDVIDGEQWYVQHGPNPTGALTYLVNRNDGLYQFHPQWGDKIVRYLHYPVSLNDDNNVRDDYFGTDTDAYTVTFHTRINALHKSVKVPAGTYDCVEVAQEYRGDAALGPNAGAPPVFEYYAPGIGLIELEWYDKTSTGTPFVYYRRVLTSVHVQ
ncbi:MAG: hypothetical protein JWQ98_1032 [Chlorobi bacterium]|nr:hypothetical protein [Chlorobiota bacterium]